AHPSTLTLILPRSRSSFHAQVTLPRSRTGRRVARASRVWRGNTIGDLRAAFVSKRRRSQKRQRLVQAPRPRAAGASCRLWIPRSEPAKRERDRGLAG